MPDLETPTPDQLAGSQLVQQAFTYWFTDHGHVRSPFPAYMHEPLRRQAPVAFAEWIKHLGPKAKEEVNDEAAMRKFEEVLFETGMKLVRTGDEVLTLRFPFLPRVGDAIDGGGAKGREGENIVRGRSLVSEGKDEFMQVEAENLATGAVWSTRFELP